MKPNIFIIALSLSFIYGCNTNEAKVDSSLKKYFDAKNIHPGQHYDDNMSAVFFDDLKMAKPDFMFDLVEASLKANKQAFFGIYYLIHIM